MTIHDTVLKAANEALRAERDQLRARVAELEYAVAAKTDIVNHNQAVFDARIAELKARISTFFNLGRLKEFDGDVGDWLTSNPEALTALVEGRAAVVPLNAREAVDKDIGTLTGLLYIDDNLVHTELLLSTVRLDKPVEVE